MDKQPALPRFVARTGLALMGAGLLLACGSNAAGIAVTVQNIAGTTVKLEVKPTVGSKLLPSESFSDLAGADQVQLGFQLPSAYVGQAVKFQIDGLDTAGCRRQTSSVELSTDTIRRYDAKTSLAAVMLPQVTSNLFAVHGTGPNDVWAVGGTGAVLHYNGCFWEQHSLGTIADIMGVYAAPRPGGGPSNAVYVITTTAVYKWDGSSWSKEMVAGLPTTAQLRAIHGSSAGEVWAFAADSSVTPSVILHRNKDLWGRDLSNGIAGVEAMRLYSLYVPDGSTVLVAGGVGAPMATPQAASWRVGTWRTSQVMTTPAQTGDMFVVWGVSDTDYWVGGDASALNHYAGGGWSQETAFKALFPSGTGAQTFKVTYMNGQSASDFWVVSFTGQPSYASRVAHYTGSWKMETQLNASFPKVTAVWAGGPNDVWFVGYDGLRVHYDGSTFTQSKE